MSTYNIIAESNEATVVAEYTPLQRRKQEYQSEVNTSTDIQSDWQEFVAKRREAELADITRVLRLKPEETRAFMENAFRDGELRTTGTDIRTCPGRVGRRLGQNFFVDCEIATSRVPYSVIYSPQHQF